MSEMSGTGGLIKIEPLAIELDDLDWWPIAIYSIEADMFPVVEDADRKVCMARLDEQGDWREVINGQLLWTVMPLRWAIPTNEIFETLTLG